MTTQTDKVLPAPATADDVADLIGRKFAGDGHGDMDSWPARLLLGLERVEVLAVTEWRHGGAFPSCRIDLWAPGRFDGERVPMRRLWPTWAAHGYRRNDRGYAHREGAPALVYELACKAAALVGLDPHGDGYWRIRPDGDGDPVPAWRVHDHLPAVRVTVR